jgi:glycolate oxidase FAD binding subunit
MTAATIDKSAIPPSGADIVPLTDTATPADIPALAAAVRQAHADGVPVYPLGGGTSLDFGLPAKQQGIGLSLAKLDRIIDYPARDMTITIEAGIRMSALADTLARERQRLPIDVPWADRATLGGVIATNWSGPLRYGHGTIRDYVIGISAVDGRGMEFKGGGRVVKNVAGYDFCKLLVGSLGTIGVVTQVTLKVKPIPDNSALVACRVKDFEQAEQLLAALVTTRTSPAAVELLAGSAWHGEAALDQLEPSEEKPFGHLVVALEGSTAEVEWMIATLAAEWQAIGTTAHGLPPDRAEALWRRLREFSAEPCGGLVAKISVPPSRMIAIARHAAQLQPDCSLQAHAASGILILRMPSFPAGGVSRQWVGELQAAAQNAEGSAAILSCSQSGELTRQAIWGKPANAAMLMEAVKKQFDPKNLLNPGRFVYWQ